MEWMENGMYYKQSINTLFVEIDKAGIRKRRGRGKVRLATAQSYLYYIRYHHSPFLHSIK